MEYLVAKGYRLDDHLAEVRAFLSHFVRERLRAFVRIGRRHRGRQRIPIIGHQAQARSPKR